MRILLLQLLLCGCLLNAGQAQLDSIGLQLPLIKVTEKALPAMHYNVLEKDSDYVHLDHLDLNLTELLQFRSGAYLRDYGNKTLSTLSIRGGSSQQTEILWNGASITNPMLGLGDLSIIPVVPFSKVRIQSMPLSGLYNPIGGTLELNSPLSDSSNYAVGYSLGQFKHQSGFLKAQYNFNERLKIGLNIFSVSDEQSFPYQEEHSSVLLPDNQPHAHYQQTGALGQISYTLNEHHIFRSSLWIQGANREIPPLRTQRKSEAAQADSFYRAQFEWTSKWNNYRHKFLYTTRNELNAYSDPLNGIDNLNRFRSHQILSHHKTIIDQQFQLKFGGIIEFVQAESGNYDGNKSADNYSFFLNPVYVLPGFPLQFDAAIRYSRQDERTAPASGHFSVNWTRGDHLLSISYNRAHRFPGLNDRFWDPGGNEDLKPELSNQLNAAYQFNWKKGPLTFHGQFNLFYKKVDQWILWAPTDQFIWKPENLLEVTAAGPEITLFSRYELSPEHSLSFQSNFLFQSVKNTGDQNTPLANNRKNLIYMPSHKLNATVSWAFMNIGLSYTHHFRSLIYTRPDLSESLPPLNLANLRLSYAITLLHQKFEIYLRAYNLWDQAYFFQPNRPAPGIHWRVGLIIQKPKL